MADIDIRSLERFPFDAFHACWVRAFSDYQVPIKLSREELTHMLRQNSVELAASVGAFCGSELVGFWVNGLRTIDGRLVAYDSGTAIVPEFRGQGIAELLAKGSTARLIERGAAEYRLEVLCSNERAYGIYCRDGFEVTRRLLCFNSDAPVFADDAPGLAFEEGPLGEGVLSHLPAPEYRPSWQNETTSALAIRDTVRVALARRGSTIAAFGLIDAMRARILQLGAIGEAWEDGAATGVLKRLWEAAGKRPIAMINVEQGAARTIAALEAAGFSIFVEQYEMKKALL